MIKKPDILLVEDNKADIRLVKEAFSFLSLDVNLHVAVNGAQALEFFTNEKTKEIASNLDLIFLDLNIPMHDGFEVLRFIKGHESFRSIPVVILTSSKYESDVHRSYRFKANAVIFKTPEFEELISMMQSAYHFWIGRSKK